MNYDVALLHDEHTLRAIEKLGNAFLNASDCAHSFNIKPLDASSIKNNESANELLCELKKAHCAFYCLSDNRPSLVESLKNKLGLYAECLIEGPSQADERIVVFDVKKECEHGFRNNGKFGREAYDVLAYGELEIERVARVAYELADKKHSSLALLDEGGSLATSLLWRKIVADINEDYPYVNVKNLTIGNLINKNERDDIVLTNRFLANALIEATSNPRTLCTTGDTSYALYAIPSSSLDDDTLLSSIASLALEYSFDISR